MFDFDKAISVLKIWKAHLIRDLYKFSFIQISLRQIV